MQIYLHWTYEYLKEYDTSIIQHTIRIKENENPFRQKLRRMNPLLLPLIETKIRKLFDAKIIVSLRISNWIANFVPVIKKHGEIRLCLDFWKPKQSVSQRKLSIHKDGSHSVEGSGFTKDIHDGWFFMV